MGGFHCHCQKNSHKLSVELFAVDAAAVAADFQTFLEFVLHPVNQT